MFPSSCEQQSFDISSEDLAKRRKSDCSDSNNLFDSIGREISISCLLRCSRSDYASLACVNRGFRSLIRSGELYRLRRLQGITEPWVYLSCTVGEWEAYDLHRARWIKLPKMLHNDSFMISVKECLVVGTELLVFGMLSNSQLVLQYSILTNSWSPGTVMNSPRCSFGSASFGAKVICAGGCDSYGVILSSAELYDSETRTWTILPSMNKPRMGCSCVFMDGKFYAIGGFSDPAELLTCGEEFDMEKGSWRIIPNMLVGLNTVNRARTVITVRNNELYATHYEDKEVIKYNKKDNVWITLGRFPENLYSYYTPLKGCGEQLIMIGAKRPIELHSWVPKEGEPPKWNMIAKKMSKGPVLMCAVMNC